MNEASGERRRWLRLTAWLLCVLPLAALADQPAGQGASSSVSVPGDDPSPGASRDPNSGGDGGQRRGMMRRHLTDEEWNEASVFLDQYSPKRMALIRQLPDGPAKERLRVLIYSRYLAVRKIQESLPQVYQLQVQRLTIEDNLFDIHRRFASAAGPQKAALRSDIRQQVQALFDNVQQDRQVRIARMKSWVADLQSRHDDDDLHRDSLITQQVQEVVHFGPNALMKEMGANGNGAALGSPTGESSKPHFHPTTNPEP
jgi:hypothetical protein